MDDKIFVWNMENGEKLCILDGHADSVTNLSLDRTDTFLVSGDLQGLVNVWKISKSPLQIQKVKSIELSEIIDIKWIFSPITKEEYLYICDVTGTVQSFTVDSLTDDSTTEMSHTFYSQGKGCSCNGFSVILDGKYACVLYGGTCSMHEECGNTNELYLCDVHTYSAVKVDLKCVANEEEDSDEGLGAGFATGKLYNSEMVAIGDWSQLILASVVSAGGNGNGVSCKLQKVPVKDGGLVTNVAFSDVLPFIAFASKHGVIGVYDVAHSRMRHLWHYEHVLPAEVASADDDDCHEPKTVSQLKWQPGKPYFVTTGLDGRLCRWDAKVSPSGDVPSWWGHSGIVWDLCLAGDGHTVVTVSEDTTGRVFHM